MTNFLKNKTIRRVLTSLVIIGTMSFAAYWAWQYLEQDKQEKAKPSAVKKRISPAQRKVVNHDMRDILSANLFNQASKQTVSLVQQAEIPKTSQQLFLHGIILSTDPENSMALIANKKRGSPLPYKQGEKLPKSGGEIYLILDGYVQIKRNGRLEKLTLIDVKSVTLQRSKSVVRRGRTQYPKTLDELKTNYKDNAQKLLDKFGLKKTANGIQLSTRKGRLPPGLKSGDVITSLSGHSLDEIESDPDIINELLDSGDIEASLERNGRTIHFKVPQKLLKQWKAFQ